MIYRIGNLFKERRQDQEGYRLEVPELCVASGEKVLVTGPSGCGKSTLLDLLGLILRPEGAGAFVFTPEAGRPVDITSLWQQGQSELLAGLRHHIGYISQTGALLPFLSVRDNIALSARLRGRPDQAFCLELAGELGLTRLLDKFPAQLSVGERQRAAIARALAGRPAVLLADEPTAALDLPKARAVMDMFMRLVDELGGTLIMVTHAPELARDRGFRILDFRQDSLAEPGLSRAVLSEVEAAL